MSIEQKIAELLEDADKLQEQQLNELKPLMMPIEDSHPASKYSGDNQLHLSKHLRKHLDDKKIKHDDVYFDGSSLVHGDKTVVGGALNSTKGHTVGDLKKALEKHASSMKEEFEDDAVELPEEFANMSLEELEEFMQTEEFEQLDELSIDLLKRARQKAYKNMADAEDAGQDSAADQHFRQAKRIGTGISHKEYKQRGNVTKDSTRTTGGLSKPKQKRADDWYKENYSVDVSEDVAALLNGETLSEEFQAKAATIFEAAVVSRVKAEMENIEEQFDVRLQEEVETIREGLIEQVDGYLNYVVEQWMTDNELALENGMKNEILESFVHGMKGLFEQHYIDVPEEKFDIIGEMQAQIEDLSEKLDEQFAANVEMNQHLKELVRESAIEEFASDMTVMDSDKFKGLAEELVFEDEDSFKAKLQTIKENYFGKKQPAQKITERFITEESTGSLNEQVDVNPTMARYLRALNGAQ